MADNVAITAGAGTNIAADDISSVWHQRMKVEFGADGAASDVSPTNPLPAGHHRNGSCIEIASGTFSIAIADSTNQVDGPTVTLPGTQYGLGDRVMVFVRNPSNQELELRLKHQVTDPNGGTTRYATQWNASGAAIATVPKTAGGLFPESDGALFIFDGGLQEGGAKFTLKAVAAVDATYTISLEAWVRN